MLRLMEGYAKIANFMSKHPESALFLRFSDINLQNILYLQAEIFGLRQNLREKEADNSSNASSEAAKRAAFDWFELRNLSGQGDEPGPDWEKFLKLRQLLCQYSRSRLLVAS